MISWKPEFSKKCSFYKTLKGHKYFHFGLFPDKIKYFISWKVKKKRFLCHNFFLVFSPKWEFSHKFWLSLLSPYGLLIWQKNSYNLRHGPLPKSNSKILEDSRIFRNIYSKSFRYFCLVNLIFNEFLGRIMVKFGGHLKLDEEKKYQQDQGGY